MPDAAPTAAQKADEPAASKSSPEGNIKETVESILVAFILAFVFRAFVVEAFVIPTGSMAPTLMGAHMRFRCADCGTDYTVNYPTTPNGADLTIPSESGQIETPIVCPNCGYHVASRGTDGDSKYAVPVHYGDRILVLKYRYLFSGPQRWDVVVFKSPELLPPAPKYTTNYIKRLVGKPGESLIILDGDIYVSTEPRPKDLNDRKTLEAFLKTFKIQRKPAYAQDALWRKVYDNDHIPRLTENQRIAQKAQPWKQPWQPSGEGWDLSRNPTGRQRRLNFDNLSGSGVLTFDAEANPDTHALTDFTAYDQYHNQATLDSRTSMPTLYEDNQEMSRGAKNAVADLKLACVYGRESGDGPFEMLLTKRDDQFRLRITPGKVQLIWRNPSGVEKTYEADGSAFAAGKSPARIDFSNVDYRVSVRVNDTEVIATGDEYHPDIIQVDEDESRRLNREGSRSTIRISAEKQKCMVDHIVLSRDIFYINGRTQGNSNRSIRGTPEPGSIVTLGPDEYFTCGDNSLISADARLWTNDVVLPGEGLPFVERGRVPARFLLGKAFFVYWPAGHRPLGTGIGIVPNFGDMRFIH